MADEMVATNGESDNIVNVPTITVPKGKYTIVGIDIDTTGRRLIDEIVQLAAYTPTDHYEQYIMPYMNLNPAARQRHQVRVISIGFYRMLKSMQTYKIIKSKSEIAALKDFLDWLEALKAKDAGSQGVILVYHEERKFIPYMILESLKKYNLLDRFLNTVKSFANGLLIAKDHNEFAQTYALRKITKLLNIPVPKIPDAVEISKPAYRRGRNNYQRDEFEFFDGSATIRAKLTYDIAMLVANHPNKEIVNTPAGFDKLHSTIQNYAPPVDADLKELQNQNENLERQNSFRPIFLNYFKTTLYHRVRAVKFRIVLAEHGHDLQSLNAAWTESQKEGLNKALEDVTELKPTDKTELIELLDSFFDPNKTVIKPVIKNSIRRRNRRPIRSRTPKVMNNEQGAGGDKQAPIPDSTTKTPDSFGGKPRGKRNPRFRQTLKIRSTLGAEATSNTTIPVKASN